MEVTTIPLARGGFVLTYRDVSHYKQQEAELSAAREQLQTVLDHMTDGVVMWDADFRVVFFNKETLRVGEFPPDLAYPGVSVLEVMRHRTGAANSARSRKARRSWSGASGSAPRC